MTLALHEMIEEVRARHANLDESQLNALIEEARNELTHIPVNVPVDETVNETIDATTNGRQ